MVAPGINIRPSSIMNPNQQPIANYQNSSTANNGLLGSNLKNPALLSNSGFNGAATPMGSLSRMIGQGKTLKKGQDSFPSEYYYQLGQWMNIFQDQCVLVKMKRNNPVLSKNSIYSKIVLHVESISGKDLSRITLKLRTNPPSKL